MIHLLLAGMLFLSGCGLLVGGASDEATLERLREAGSDLSKPHPFDFYFYHPDQTGAQQLCGALVQDGFDTIVTDSAAGDDWLCLASLTMLPTLENLTKLNARFEALIAEYGGEYDGWETMVIE
jgi:hypothetical protein